MFVFVVVVVVLYLLSLWLLLLWLLLLRRCSYCRRVVVSCCCCGCRCSCCCGGCCCCVIVLVVVLWLLVVVALLLLLLLLSSSSCRHCVVSLIVVSVTSIQCGWYKSSVTCTRILYTASTWQYKVTRGTSEIKSYLPYFFSPYFGQNGQIKERKIRRFYLALSLFELITCYKKNIK